MSHIFSTPGSKDSFLANQVKLLAAQTLKIASINGFKELDDLENELEAEIEWENRAPRETLEKIRRKGEHILHARYCLLAIVILNVVDCIMVIGELLVEFHHMNHKIQSEEDNADVFIQKLQGMYPNATDLVGIHSKNINTLYQKVLLSEVCWSNGTMPLCSGASYSNSGVHNYFNLSSADVDIFSDHDGPVHKLESKISHILHYISVSILIVLCIETFIKIFCTVPRFFKHKLEVFDAFIVVISLILDLVFIDGLLELDIGAFVIAVTFILPWRIIRILNSLIVVVVEKERYSLKMLYKQKKKVDKVNVENTHKIHDLEKQLERLKALCISHDVQPFEIQKIVGLPEKTSALGKLAFRAAGSLTPAPMTATSNSSTPNLFSSFANGSMKNTSDVENQNPFFKDFKSNSVNHVGNGSLKHVNEEDSKKSEEISKQPEELTKKTVEDSKANAGEEKKDADLSKEQESNSNDKKDDHVNDGTHVSKL